MSLFQPVLRKIRLLGLAVILILSTPMSVLAQADTAASTENTSTITASSATGSTGVDHPTGAAAGTYHFNAETGLWENEYYTWNPTTHQTTPKFTSEYTYNQQSGLWDYKTWEFKASEGKYAYVTASVVSPPAGAVTHGGPAPVVVTPTPTPLNPSSPAGGSGTSTGTLPAASALTAGDPVITPALTNGATPTAVDAATTNGLAINNTTGVVLNNNITSLSQSGNVALLGNRNAGNVMTGDASVMATIINVLQSSSALSGAGLATFATDIQGDVNGDMLIDPAQFMQPAALSTSDLNALTINNKTDGTILNNVVLGAASGNATAVDNRNIGDVATGNAAAVANVMNLINSVVAANQSFLGVVNIYGNFTGNILVPTESLNALLASNGAVAVAPASNTNDSTKNTNIDTTTTQQIANNVDLAATSGNATLTGNRNTGNATTGNALTKLTILNLTGRQVNAANSLLVFVNVLGTWVGVIMDAPAGATAAALTGGATDAATDAAVVGNENAKSASSQSGITSNDSQSIVNNITARATSGNATLANNRDTGNATTGNATASANIANILGSHFSLSNWFGVLFINVFGSWHGSFGTAAPAIRNVADAPATAPSASSLTAATGTARVFRFVSGTKTSLGLRGVGNGGFGSGQDYQEVVDTAVSEVLAAEDVIPVVQQLQNRPPVRTQRNYSLSMLPIALGLTGLTVVGADRFRTIRRKIHYQLFR